MVAKKSNSIKLPSVNEARVTFIKTMRQKREFTQEYVAKQLGMQRQTYRQIETGERDLTLSETEKLSNIFSISLEDFLNESDTNLILDVVDSDEPSKEQQEIRISIPKNNLEKFKQIFLYILKKVGGKPNIGMTALYKLLYFIDFDYYEKYEEQLMGLVYIKNHYGPTPVIFDKVAEEMIADNQIEIINSKFYKHKQKKYLINPEIKLDLKMLNGQEKEHIDWELQRLSDLNATELSDRSHKDVPWLSAEPNEKLDYEAVFYRTPETSVREYNDNSEDSVL